MQQQRSNPLRAPDTAYSALDLCDKPDWQSIVAGTVFGVDETISDLCNTGINLYGLATDGIVLGDASYRIAWSKADTQQVYCDARGGLPGTVSGRLDACRGTDVAMRIDEDLTKCQECKPENNWESEIPYIRSGFMAVVRDDWNGVGGGPQETVAWPVSAASCPSPEDVCGDLRDFTHVDGIKDLLDPELPKSLRITSPIWVNSPATFALIDDAKLGWMVISNDKGVSALAVPALKGVDGSADGSSPGIIGVRWHPDLRPLLARTCAALCNAPTIAVIAAPTPPTEDADDAPAPTPTYLNMCEKTFAVGAPCPEAPAEENCTYGVEEDPEEDAAGDDAYFDDSETEEPEPDETEEEEQAPTKAKAPAKSEVPAAPQPSAIDPDNDSRTSKQLGNACFEHIKADALDLAHEECTLALTRADNDKSRGALHFNLGLIAEKRGQIATAREAFETSLRLRPDNAAVLKRLNSLK